MIQGSKNSYIYLFEDPLLEEMYEFFIYKEVLEDSELIGLGSYIKSI